MSRRLVDREAMRQSKPKRSPTAFAAVRPVSRQSELEAALAAGETPLISAPGLFVVAGDAVVQAVAGVGTPVTHTTPA